MTVSVLIPAYREADRIGATVRAALQLPSVSEVVVIDDGSPDDTASVAESAGARVVRLSKNQGKAGALMAGGNVATGDLLLLLDADLGDTAAQSGVLLAPVLSGEADVSIATFPVVPGRGGGMGVVVRASRWGIRRATGRTMAAPLSGQRCLTRAAWDAAQPLARGFGVETAMTIAILKAGFRVVEVETQMDHRVTQNDWRGRVHRLRQLRDVLLALAAPPVPRPAGGRADVTTPGQWLARKLGLVKPNFQGVEIPAASGLTFLLLAPVSLALGAGAPVAVATALGTLGFLDDRFGDRSVGGFRGHLKALFTGKPTTGSLKLVAGGVAALAAAYVHNGPTPGFLVDAPMIALAANALNLLDLRPGRACFGFVLLAAPSLFVRPPGVSLWPALGGFLLEWPFDARAKAMLGDTGSNFLGALAGALAMESLPLGGRATMLVLLLSLNLAAERVSLSQAISKTPWLNWLDRRLGVRSETS